jgi:galactokinase
MMVGYQQAAIRVEQEQEFEELKSAINRAFDPDKVEEFLKRVRSNGSRVRDLESALTNGVFEKVDEVLAKSGKTARALYESLALSDQAQMREFYLSKLETVRADLRHKFKKLYQYY